MLIIELDNGDTFAFKLPEGRTVVDWWVDDDNESWEMLEPAPGLH